LGIEKGEEPSKKLVNVTQWVSVDKRARKRKSALERHKSHPTKA
jgi:hypothetical protein